MAASRAKKQVMRAAKSPYSGTKAVEGNSKTAKGSSKQFNYKQPKATGPNYRQGFPGVCSEEDLK